MISMIKRLETFKCQAPMFLLLFIIMNNNNIMNVQGQRIARYELPFRLEYQKAELRYAAHHAFIDKRHKLVYCGIPKVACTEFFRFFFRLKGEHRDRGRWLGDPHFRSDRPLLSMLSTDEATAIMNDPAYTKFVYFRDPVDRLRSAWMDKFHNWHRYTMSYKVKLYQNKNLTFSEFVDILLEKPSRNGNRGLGPKTNPHWRPQRYLCNLEKFLPLYNFIGSFSHLFEHNKRMLQALGLWEQYGQSGWSRPQRVKRFRRPLDPIHQNISTPHSAMFERNIASHRMRRKEFDFVYANLLTPQLIDKIKRAYWMDYEMLNAIGFYEDGALPTDGRRWTANTSFLNSEKRAVLCTFDRAFDCPPY
mmetsp:Transcript_12819/g.19226  ORF Transcript_12819/g.19226 Transcript_12819/m.19226 type:complete len:361 (+) Transcript_12819:1-1083(+)